MGKIKQPVIKPLSKLLKLLLLLQDAVERFALVAGGRGSIRF